MSNPEAEAWLERVRAIKRGRSFGRRAPHKPLLLLFAIGRLFHDHHSRVTFESLELPLLRLLRNFGPPSKKPHPEQPFWHLQSDGLWTVSATDIDRASIALAKDRLPTGFAHSPTAAQLRRLGTVGQLQPDFEAALLADRRLMCDVVQTLLKANWPPSLHEDVCTLAGLDIAALEGAVAAQRVREAPVPERRRDPEFRVKVLRAYRYRCAMCGYDGRLDAAAVGLEAAHVRWWAEGGPDETNNGLCLCVMHHKLFDRGVLGIRQDRSIMVSGQFVGWGNAAEEIVMALAGHHLAAPRAGESKVSQEHLRWHEDEVFRSPAL